MGGRNRLWLLIAAIAVAFFLLGVFSATLAQNEGEADISVPTGTDALPPGVTSATTYEGNGVPRVLARGTWEGFEFSGGAWQPTDGLRNLLRWLPQPDNQPPDYNALDRIIVHDQGCLNPSACMANAEKFPIQTIQGIYRSHAVTRGWGDIGYNYIIDRQGRIYEGRYGGNGVRAAHIYADARCENLNVGSAGVLLLGDLRAGPMTPAQSESLARLAAWLGVANGVDFSETAATTTTWKNPGSGGQCDLTQGGFTGSLTAARLVSHGDVEPGNSDHFDLSPQRILASTLTAQFSAFAYRIDANAPLYFIRDGALHEASEGSAEIQIDAAQLALFPRASAAALPDGALVKSATRSRVYVIESGKRRPIPTADLFVARGYQWEAIQTVADRELALIRLGAPVPYSDAALVKGSGQDVFVFESGSLRHVTSAALFSALKYAWTSIRTLLDQDIEQYPKGEPKTFPDGTLVKSPAPRVYRIEGGARRAVFSAELFSALQFSWGDLKQLSEEELGRYPEGAALSWPDGALLRGEGQERVYFVQQGYRRWIQTAEAFRELGLRWGDVRVVSSAELGTMPEAQGIATLADRSAEPQLLSGATDGQSPSPSPESPPPSAPSPLGEEPTMRIGLATLGGERHAGGSVTLSYDLGASIKRNGSIVATLSANETYTFSPQSGEVWRGEPIGSGVATVQSYTDLAYNGTNDNRFRGVIEIATAADGNRWLINELTIEDYLKGIAETGNGAPQEYGKTFAVAARSYAYYHFLRGGKRAGEPFIIRNTTADQWYKGYNFELRGRDPVAATTATRGVVGIFNGGPILAAYSSGAPGATLAACALSQTFCDGGAVKPEFAYLRGGATDPVDTKFTYTSCGGAVHCVGLDASGARRMAELGSSYADILTHYYPGSAPTPRWE